MKKASLLAATLMATAFCGMCAGCASNIEVNEDRTPTTAVSQSAETTEHKVILNPGWYWTSGASAAVDNTVAEGATKLTNSEADAYHVENGYFATVAAGAELPAAETTRTGMSFVAWTYAKDGEVVAVDKMPSALKEDLYLFAKWKTGGTGGGTGGGGGGGDETGDVKTDNNLVIDGKAVADLTDNTANIDKNKNPTLDKEFMAVGIKLNAGATISFKIDGKTINSWIEAGSKGLSKTGFQSSEITTNGEGTYKFYIKHWSDSGNWTVYATNADL